jgi:hypothetical protein
VRLPLKYRKLVRLLQNRRAISAVISNVILVGAVIAVSFVVLFWAQYRSSAYNQEYSEAVDSDIAKLKERLAFEYIFYNEDDDILSVYLMNCGTINDTTVETAYVSTSSGNLIEVFTDITLFHFNGSEISDQDLDISEEGYFVLSSFDDLAVGTSYLIKVITGRGSSFEQSFIA